MIVRPAHDGLHLITQPDHAHLARSIMERCVPLAAQRRRAAILHAIGEHDNGWAEPDAEPIVDPDTGRVADFISAPSSVRQAVWPRAVDRLSADPWAAALVAQHAITVYDRFRSDREWDTFFARMQAARDAMLRASAGDLQDLLADYAFVRLADLISLTFCVGWTDEQRFADWSIRLLGTRVIVRPDIFGGESRPIGIAARTIPDRPFRSDEELRDVLREAPGTMLRGDVAGD